MSFDDILTTPKFDSEIKKLKRRYPKIGDDFEKFLDELEINNNLGDEIQGVLSNGNKVFKARMANTSANKGKSGGFRIIEYLVTSSNTVYLVDIYSKTDAEDIPKIRILDRISKV